MPNLDMCIQAAGEKCGKSGLTELVVAPFNLAIFKGESKIHSVSFRPNDFPLALKTLQNLKRLIKDQSRLLVEWCTPSRVLKQGVVFLRKEIAGDCDTAGQNIAYSVCPITLVFLYKCMSSKTKYSSDVNTPAAFSAFNRYFFV